MATITPLKNTPHTRIENSIIINIAEIGVYCYAVYSAIKMHVNQTTGDCFPSYATIARITGIHRSTVIECVKKLRALKHISPQWRFKEDGSHTSNQYNFQAAESSAPSKKIEDVVKTEQCGLPERPPIVGTDDHPGRPERPKQSEINKKIPDFSVVLFRPNCMLASEEYPMKAHKNQWLSTMPSPPAILCGAANQGTRHGVWGEDAFAVP